MDTAPDKQEFSVSELEFREIDGSASPALKGKLQAKEAVHACADISELEQNRLAPADKNTLSDKHCYGLFAPGHEVPEVVVYVKLAKLPEANGAVKNVDLPGDILETLNHPATAIKAPNTAVFYTITNFALDASGKPDPEHPVRLRGKAATELIHQAAAHVQKEYGVTHFTTLSPMRGFAAWLKNAIDHADAQHPLFEYTEKSQLDAINDRHRLKDHSAFATIMHMHEEFHYLTSAEQKFCRQLMQDLGLYYLAHEKREGLTSDALNPVAHFHLGNGAQLAHVHFQPQGHSTAREGADALGLMVNYRYEPAKLAERKEQYGHGAVALDSELEVRHESRLRALLPPPIEPDNRIYQPVIQQTVSAKNGGISGLGAN